MKAPIVVLISGSGSNLQALIDQSLEVNAGFEIKAVISNKADAYGLERARKHKIPTVTISHKDFATREAFDFSLQQEIENFAPELVVLAGFMRILTSEFTKHFEGRMLNIHPSLLPKFKGLNTHQRAIDAGEEYHGVSVHFVTAELDAGAVVIQAKTPIEKEDTADSLAHRIHSLEHVIYPLAVKWFSDNRLSYKDGQLTLDAVILPETGIMYHPELI